MNLLTTHWGVILRKLVSICVIFVFFAQTVLPAYAQTLLPQAGVRVNLSPPFTPAILRGVKVYTDNPFKFDFIVEGGDKALSDTELKDETTRLIKYFLASLTTPEDDMWVNLSPFEKDRIVPESFGKTEMGRDLLAQDYLLKQITASILYPEDDMGKKFWGRVYQLAYEQFGTTDVPINTFNKVWVVPDKAEVYENRETAVVTKTHLKVLLEEDYLALSKTDDEGGVALEEADHKFGSNIIGKASQVEEDAKRDEINALGSRIIREIIIPEIEREVNEGKNFAQLRQVYHSLILATWYKRKLKDSILTKVYADKNKTKGVASDDEEATQKIYAQYLEAFKKGVYNYIKEDYDAATQEVIPRKYVSGGFQFGKRLDRAMLVSTDSASLKPLLNTPLAADRFVVTAGLETTRSDRAMLSGQNTSPENPDLSPAWRELTESQWYYAAHEETDYLYHDLRHSLTVGHLAYEFGRERKIDESFGFAGEELSRLMELIGYLHDFHPGRAQDTPPRVFDTLKFMDDDWNKTRSLSGREGQSELRTLLQEDQLKFTVLKAFIQRSEFPFTETNPNTAYADISPVRRYQNMLEEIKSLDPTPEQSYLRFTLQEAPMFSEYIDKLDGYITRDFRDLLGMIRGLALESKNVNAPAFLSDPQTLIANTRKGFLLKLGLPEAFRLDEQIGVNLGVQGRRFPHLDEFFSIVPEEYRRNFQTNLKGFEILEQELEKGEPLEAASQNAVKAVGADRAMLTNKDFQSSGMIDSGKYWQMIYRDGSVNYFGWSNVGGEDSNGFDVFLRIAPGFSMKSDGNVIYDFFVRPVSYRFEDGVSESKFYKGGVTLTFKNGTLDGMSEKNISSSGERYSGLAEFLDHKFGELQGRAFIAQPAPVEDTALAQPDGEDLGETWTKYHSINGPDRRVWDDQVWSGVKEKIAKESGDGKTYPILIVGGGSMLEAQSIRQEFPDSVRFPIVIVDPAKPSSQEVTGVSYIQAEAQSVEWPEGMTKPRLVLAVRSLEYTPQMDETLNHLRETADNDASFVLLMNHPQSPLMLRLQMDIAYGQGYMQMLNKAVDYLKDEISLEELTESVREKLFEIEEQLRRRGGFEDVMQEGAASNYKRFNSIIGKSKQAKKSAEAPKQIEAFSTMLKNMTRAYEGLVKQYGPLLNIRTKYGLDKEMSLDQFMAWAGNGGEYSYDAHVEGRIKDMIQAAGFEQGVESRTISYENEAKYLFFNMGAVSSPDRAMLVSAENRLFKTVVEDEAYKADAQEHIQEWNLASFDERRQMLVNGALSGPYLVSPAVRELMMYALYDNFSQFRRWAIETNNYFMVPSGSGISPTYLLSHLERPGMTLAQYGEPVLSDIPRQGKPEKFLEAPAFHNKRTAILIAFMEPIAVELGSGKKAQDLIRRLGSSRSMSRPLYAALMQQTLRDDIEKEAGEWDRDMARKFEEVYGRIKADPQFPSGQQETMSFWEVLVTEILRHEWTINVLGQNDPYQWIYRDDYMPAFMQNINVPKAGQVIDQLKVMMEQRAKEEGTVKKADRAMLAIDQSEIEAIEDRITAQRAYRGIDYVRLAYWRRMLKKSPALVAQGQPLYATQNRIFELIERLNEELSIYPLYTSADFRAQMQEGIGDNQILIVSTNENFWALNSSGLSLEGDALKGFRIDPDGVIPTEEEVVIPLEARMTFKLLPADRVTMADSQVKLFVERNPTVRVFEPVGITQAAGSLASQIQTMMGEARRYPGSSLISVLNINRSRNELSTAFALRGTKDLQPIAHIELSRELPRSSADQMFRMILDRTPDEGAVTDVWLTPLDVHRVTAEDRANFIRLAGIVYEALPAETRDQVRINFSKTMFGNMPEALKPQDPKTPLVSLAAFVREIKPQAEAKPDRAMLAVAEESSIAQVADLSVADFESFAAQWQTVQNADGIKGIENNFKKDVPPVVTLSEMESLFAHLAGRFKKPEEWRLIGKVFRDYLKQRGFTGYANQYLARFNRQYIMPDLFADRLEKQNHMLKVFASESVMEEFLASWQSVYTIQHLKWFGPHADRESYEGETYEFFDNDSIATGARRMLALLLQYRDAPELNTRPEALPGFTGTINFTYRDLMLWSVVAMMNPMVHDYMLEPFTQPVTPAETRRAGYQRWPQGGMQSMEYYMRQILSDVSWTDGTNVHRATDEEVGALLLAAFSNDYEGKGLRSPMAAISYENALGPDLWTYIIPSPETSFLADQTMILAAPESVFDNNERVKSNFFPPVDLNRRPYMAGLPAYMFLERLPVMQEKFPSVVQKIGELDGNGEARKTADLLAMDSQKKLDEFLKSDRAMLSTGDELADSILAAANFKSLSEPFSVQQILDNESMLMLYGDEMAEQVTSALQLLQEQKLIEPVSTQDGTFQLTASARDFKPDVSGLAEEDQDLAMLAEAGSNASQNNLLHPWFVRYNEALRETVNPRNKSVTVAYGGAAADVSSVLLTTGFTRALWINRVAVSADKLREAVGRWDTPLDGVEKYFSDKFSNGFSFGEVDGKIEDFLVQELKAMGVDRDSLDVITDEETGNPLLTFAFPGESAKRQIVFIKEDIKQLSPGFINRFKGRIDIYYDKASQNLFYENPSLVNTVASLIKSGGFFVANAATTRQSSFKTLISGSLGNAFRSVTDGNKDMAGLKAQRSVGQERYGWEMDVWQSKGDNAMLGDEAVKKAEEIVANAALSDGWDLRATALMNKIGITKGQRILSVGPANNIAHLLYGMFVGARVDVNQPEIYAPLPGMKGINHLETLERALSFVERYHQFKPQIGTLYTAPIQEAPIKDARYEVVVALNVLDGVEPEEAQEIITEILRVVKNNGIIVFSAVSTGVDPQITEFRRQAGALNGSVERIEGSGEDVVALRVSKPDRAMLAAPERVSQLEGNIRRQHPDKTVEDVSFDDLFIDTGVSSAYRLNEELLNRTLGDPQKVVRINFTQPINYARMNAKMNALDEWGEAGEIFWYERLDGAQDTRTWRFVIKELLKNAFVHGNKLRGDLPVYAHIDFEQGVVEVYDLADEVTDDAAYEEDLKRARTANLHGADLGVSITRKLEGLQYRYSRVRGGAVARVYKTGSDDRAKLRDIERLTKAEILTQEITDELQGLTALQSSSGLAQQLNQTILNELSLLKYIVDGSKQGYPVDAKIWDRVPQVMTSLGERLQKFSDYTMASSVNDAEFTPELAAAVAAVQRAYRRRESELKVLLQYIRQTQATNRLFDRAMLGGELSYDSQARTLSVDGAQAVNRETVPGANSDFFRYEGSMIRVLRAAYDYEGHMDVITGMGDRNLSPLVFASGRTKEGNFFLEEEIIDGEDVGTRVRRTGESLSEADIEQVKQLLTGLIDGGFWASDFYNTTNVMIGTTARRPVEQAYWVDFDSVRRVEGRKQLAGLYLKSLDEEVLWAKADPEGRIRAFLQAMAPAAKPDRAVLSDEVGGIDFNADKMNLEVRNDGGEIKFNFDPAQVESLNIEGFIPVILNVQPLKDLPLLLGIKEDGSEMAQL